jgi:transcriptional regulator with XRE-family HTH domain
MKFIRNEEHVDHCKMMGANLRYMRIAKGLTQTKVGQSLNIRFQQIQKYEAGSNCLSAWRLKQLADFFETSPLDILDPNYIAESCQEKKESHV